MENLGSKKDAGLEAFEKSFGLVTEASFRLAKKFFGEVLKDTDVQVIETPFGLTFIMVILVVKEGIKKGETFELGVNIIDFLKELEGEVKKSIKEEEELKASCYIIEDNVCKEAIPVIFQSMEDIVMLYTDYLLTLVVKEELSNE